MQIAMFMYNQGVPYRRNFIEDTFPYFTHRLSSHLLVLVDLIPIPYHFLVNCVLTSIRIIYGDLRYSCAC